MQAKLPTLFRQLEEAISKGEHDRAAILARELAMCKVSCSLKRVKKAIPDSRQFMWVVHFIGHILLESFIFRQLFVLHTVYWLPPSFAQNLCWRACEGFGVVKSGFCRASTGLWFLRLGAHQLCGYACGCYPLPGPCRTFVLMLTHSSVTLCVTLLIPVHSA